MTDNTICNPVVFENCKDLYVALPHSRALGFKFESVEGIVPKISVPYSKAVVGNADTGVVHGGVITTLVDVTGAISVAARLKEFEILATLDLRIDYLKPAIPDKTIYASSICYRLSEQVAFCRVTCFQDETACDPCDVNDPFAISVQTYMRTQMSKEQQEETPRLIQEFLKQTGYHP